MSRIEIASKIKEYKELQVFIKQLHGNLICNKLFKYGIIHIKKFTRSRKDVYYGRI